MKFDRSSSGAGVIDASRRWARPTFGDKCDTVLDIARKPSSIVRSTRTTVEALLYSAVFGGASATVDIGTLRFHGLNDLSAAVYFVSKRRKLSLKDARMLALKAIRDADERRDVILNREARMFAKAESLL